MVSLFNSLRQFKDIHMYDLSLKNLIRSKEEEIRKQEADIAKKTHEKALLEQPLSQTPIDFTSNSLYKVSFAGRQYKCKFSSIQFNFTVLNLNVSN